MCQAALGRDANGVRSDPGGESDRRKGGGARRKLLAGATSAGRGRGRGAVVGKAHAERDAEAGSSETVPEDRSWIGHGREAVPGDIFWTAAARRAWLSSGTALTAGGPSHGEVGQRLSPRTDLGSATGARLSGGTSSGRRRLGEPGCPRGQILRPAGHRTARFERPLKTARETWAGFAPGRGSASTTDGAASVPLRQRRTACRERSDLAGPRRNPLSLGTGGVARRRRRTQAGTLRA